MRIIRVNDEESNGNTLLWVAAGAALGLVAGALIAERMSGRKISGRTLLRRAKSLSGIAVKRWQPLMGAAMALRDAWDARDDEPDDPPDDAEALADGADEDLDEELEASGDDDAFEDDGLDARVLEAFANDPILAERGVEIEEPEEGLIVLHGRVHTAREVKHAVTLARGVPGVESVKQRLLVRDRR